MMKFTPTLALACVAAAASSASGQLVYSHFELPATVGSAVVSPGWEVGEYITFQGGAQRVGLVEFKFGAISWAPDGEGTLNVNFYSDAGGAPGALLGTFSTAVSLVGSEPIDVSVDAGGLSVPGSVWVSTLFIQESGGVPGVRMTTPEPTVGAVSPIRAFREAGAGDWGTDLVGDWMTMQISAAASCPADLNGDGLVDFADYLEFLNRYDALDLSVDFNQDGLVDFADYLEFLNLYDAGC